MSAKDGTSCPPGQRFRADLKLCLLFQDSCSVLTAKTCLQQQKEECALDCTARFEKEMRADAVHKQTVNTSLVTLFFLGCVLGLLFAKMYWVDPLLDLTDKLQGNS
jgi:hypothetical protein